MKKILNLFLMAIAIFTLASCIVDGGNTTRFEIDGYPKTTYVLGEKFDWTGFSVKINDETPKDKDDAAEAGVEFPIKFPGTDQEGTFTQAGTFTVKVTYKGLNASFQYTVLESSFANGNGTATAPYQISTVEQFKVALETKGKTERTYYTLVNDIDFNGKLEDRTAESHVTENVEINGQGYALRNVNGILGYRLVGSTIKNIDIHFSEGKNEGEKGEFTYQKRGAIFEYLNGRVTFENIKTFGKIDFKTSNASIFGQIRVENKEIENVAVLRNCDNYASFTNLGTYGAVFTSGVQCDKSVAGETYGYGTWYLLNCKNYGQYIATYVGLINPNYSYLDDTARKAYYVLDENTKNFGELISISANSDAIYSQSNPTGILTSLLCAFNEKLDMSTVFKHFYKYESAEDFISINGSNTSGMQTFGSEEYKKMAVVDVKGMKLLTYNFSIEKNNVGKYEFAITKGYDSQTRIAKFVISLSGGSTKHDEEGKPGLHSANSTFATIECTTLEEANALGLFKPDEIYNYSSWELKHGLKWEKELSELPESARLSECLYKVTEGEKHAYIVVPCESNGYATKDDNTISFISIVALDEDGKVIGGMAIDKKKI